MPLSDTDCSGRGFAIAELASAAAKLEGAEDIDGVMYYLPEGELTPACGGSAWGTLGICSVGQLTDVNDKRAEATTPPYVVRASTKQSAGWHAGCWVRYQNPSHSARANIGAHEFGHFLGLGHAGGSGLTLKATGPLEAYGDPSGVMGNDGAKKNSFSGPARYYLGTMPAASLERDVYTAATLRALSLGPDRTDKTKSDSM